MNTMALNDLMAIGFAEAASTEWNVIDTGPTNVQKVHLVQGGISDQDVSNIVDIYNYGIPFESREIITPFVNFAFTIGLTTDTAAWPPDNRATGAQKGKKYLCEMYFKNAHNEEMWIQYWLAQLVGKTKALPQQFPLTQQVNYRAVKSRIVISNTDAKINGKP